MPKPHVPTAYKPIGYDVPADTFYVWFGYNDVVTSYDITVAEDSAFSSLMWNLTTSAAGLPHGNLPLGVPYAGTTLVELNTYYWRVRARNASGTTNWSSTVSFRVMSTATDTDAYSTWAHTILQKLSNGVQVTGLGTLIPEGTEVAALLTQEYRDQLHVVDSYHGEPIDRYVEVVGQSWSLDRDNGWTVDDVTQDVAG